MIAEHENFLAQVQSASKTDLADADLCKWLEALERTAAESPKLKLSKEEVLRVRTEATNGAKAQISRGPLAKARLAMIYLRYLTSNGKEDELPEFLALLSKAIPLGLILSLPLQELTYEADKTLTSGSSSQSRATPRGEAKSSDSSSPPASTRTGTAKAHSKYLRDQRVAVVIAAVERVIACADLVMRHYLKHKLKKEPIAEWIDRVVYLENKYARIIRRTESPLALEHFRRSLHTFTTGKEHRSEQRERLLKEVLAQGAPRKGDLGLPKAAELVDDCEYYFRTRDAHAKKDVELSMGFLEYAENLWVAEFVRAGAEASANSATSASAAHLIAEQVAPLLSAVQRCMQDAGFPSRTFWWYNVDRYRKLMLKELHRCAACDRSAVRRCLECSQVRYCSPACQKADWPVHRVMCTSAVPTSQVKAEMVAAVPWRAAVPLYLKDAFSASERISAPTMSSRDDAAKKTSH